MAGRRPCAILLVQSTFPESQQHKSQIVLMRDATCRGSPLRNFYCPWADVTRADVTRADVTRADVTTADVTRADATRADVTRADVTRADDAQRGKRVDVG